MYVVGRDLFEFQLSLINPAASTLGKIAED